LLSLLSLQWVSLGKYKKMKILLVILVAFFSLLSGCSPSKSPQLVAGGLYYTPAEKGGYSVLKILKMDDRGVHVRIYSNVFPTLPKDIDESKLYMAGVNHKPNETMGMGHTPLSLKTFEGWNATFFQQSTVKEKELEGYKEWEKAKGGYF
jgi:hypothetical protein